MSFDYTTSVKAQRTKVCDSAWFHTVAQSTKVIETNYRIAQAHERKRKGEISESEFNKIKTEQKKQLPVFLFHAHFSDSKRWNASAVPSGLSIFDIDHIPDPEGEWKSISPRAKQLGIVLAHLTPSCEGLRLVFIIPEEIRQAAKHPGEELAQGQKWLAGQLGITDYDECVKDYARCSFAVPEGYIFYIDEERLFNTSTPNYPPPSPPEREGGLNTSSAEQPTLTHKSNHSPLRTEGSGEVLGEVLSPENLRIFSEMLEVSHLTVADLNADGSRHNNLLLLLSKGAARLMPKSQFLACMKHAAPDFYEERDCQDLIDDFYTKYADPNRPMSRALQKVYEDSLKRTNNEAIEIVEESGEKRFHLNIEAMPRALRDTLVTTPEHLRMAVMLGVMPCIMTYIRDVTFKHVDGTVQEPTLQTFVLGPQASGKGAVTRMVNVWAAPMIEHDQRLRDALDKWRQKREIRSANEELPTPPEQALQYTMPTNSKKQVLDQLVALNGGYIYIFAPEADSIVNSNKAGQWSNITDVARMAWDNDRWGMSYANGTTKMAPVRMNQTAMGTIRSFQRMFPLDNIENGLATRSAIVEVPDASFQRLIPYADITPAMESNINQAVVLLSNTHGRMPMPRMSEAVMKWADAKLREAALAADRVMDLFRKRTALMMFRIGVTLYMIEGKESDRIIKLAWQLADYILYEQMKWFGEPLMEMRKNSTVKLYSPRTVSNFDRLKKTFNLDDMQKVFPNKSRNALSCMASYWVRNGYVAKSNNHTWTKNK